MTPLSSPRAAHVHQAPWPGELGDAPLRKSAGGPGVGLPGSPRTTVAKLAVLDKALAELRGAQSHELAKASGGPGSFSSERDEWLRRAVDAVERYRAHLARKALLENDQEALGRLSATDIEAAGTQLAKVSIGAGRSPLGAVGRLPRRTVHI